MATSTAEIWLVRFLAVICWWFSTLRALCSACISISRNGCISKHLPCFFSDINIPKCAHMLVVSSLMSEGKVLYQWASYKSKECLYLIVELHYIRNKLNSILYIFCREHIVLPSTFVPFLLWRYRKHPPGQGQRFYSDPFPRHAHASTANFKSSHFIRCPKLQFHQLFSTL